MTPDQANIILSGISSITEDIKTQEYLVSSICGEHFQDIIQDSKSDEELYQKVQAASQKYLEDELHHSEDRIRALEDDIAHQKETVAKLSEGITDRDDKLNKSQAVLTSTTEELEKTRRQIGDFAVSKIMPRYMWKNNILPCILALATVSYVVFIALQFFFGDKPWNFAVLFFTWVGATPFGSWVGDFVYTIDLFLGGVLGWALKKWMRNPFNKCKKELSKVEMVQKYITENKLG